MMVFGKPVSPFTKWQFLGIYLRFLGCTPEKVTKSQKFKGSVSSFKIFQLDSRTRKRAMKAGGGVM